MHDFNPLRDFFGPVILIVILLIGFGVMSGANTKALVSAFLDLVVSLLKVVLLTAAKILPPLLTLVMNGLTLLINKTVGVIIKAIEHKPNPAQIENQQTSQTVQSKTQEPEPVIVQPQDPAKTPPQTPPATPPANPVVSGLKKVYDSTTTKKPSPNPYEDDPEIDIVEK